MLSNRAGADELVMKLYENNYDLCARISAELIGTFLTLWARNPADISYLVRAPPIPQFIR